MSTKELVPIIAPPIPPSVYARSTRSVSHSQSLLAGVTQTRSPIFADLEQGYGAQESVIPTEVTTFDGSEVDRSVTIRDREGAEVGSVTVPEGTAGVLILASDARVVIIGDIVSQVVDITIVSTEGETITVFDDPIEICFETEEEEGDVCLGFFNDEGRWECEDYCLKSSDGRLCGESDHLTNFALLLSTADSGEKCGSSSKEYVIAYLSMAFVVAAIVAVAVVVLSLEIRFRVKSQILEKSFRDLERATVDLTVD